jgi:hypothetical protein
MKVITIILEGNDDVRLAQVLASGVSGIGYFNAIMSETPSEYLAVVDEVNTLYEHTSK